MINYDNLINFLFPARTRAPTTAISYADCATSSRCIRRRMKEMEKQN